MWDCVKFAELFRHDPRQAFEYRLQVLWDPIPEEYLNASDIVVGEIESKDELSEDDLRKLLKDAWVKFFAWAKMEKLVSLCQDNNLI